MKKVIVLCILISGVWAQNNSDQDPRAIIEKVRIYRMSQELDLTTEQAIEFFPKLKDFQKIEQKFVEEKTRVLNELRDKVTQGAPDKDILALLGQFEKAHRRRLENQVETMKALFEILTPVQQAKFLIFQDDFNREIRDILKEIKKHRDLNP